MSLKISTAGVRGIIGEGLRVETGINFSQAFSTYLEGGKVAIARDSRPSGSLIRSAVLAGTLASGSQVVDFEVIPTPTLQIALAQGGFDGGIMIGAGHNPLHWNALKFLAEDGAFFNAIQGRELLEIYHHGEFRKATWDQIKPVEKDGRALDLHRRSILQLLDRKSIQDRRFTVAVDCCNGPCSLITPVLLEELGCRVVALNDDVGRPFPHQPNPTPDNMSQLEALVRAAGADVGFAHDAEGQRLGIVTEDGEALGQEYTLALVCRIVLGSGRCQGPIVTNLSTSRMIDSVGDRFEVRVIRTPIGQAYVSEKAAQTGADIAGEGSGQVNFPGLHPGPDGIAALALILEYMAKNDVTISSLARELPRLHMQKENLRLAPNDIFHGLERFRKEAAKTSDEFAIDLSDGVKLDSDRGWLHVRASTTESMLRIISEASDPEEARRLHRWAREAVLR